VYALNLNGEVLVRYGISEENSDGDYWKKIPGAFSALSGKLCSLFDSYSYLEV